MGEPRFGGVYAATLTPYDSRGHVDAGVVRTLTRYLINEGLTGACPAGTTGEFPFLTREERALVGRSACEAAGEEGRIVAGVWGATGEERASLAREAEGHGAAGVFLTIPYYYPSSPAHLVEWYRGVHRATGLPVFAYNIPQATGSEIPLEVLDTLAKEGTIGGYKDSSPSADRLREVVKLLRGRVAVFAGSESLFVEARALGVDGFISGIANVFPRTVAGVWRGDREAGERLGRIKETVKRCGGVPALKYLLSLRGFAVGPAREPIAPVTDEARNELEGLEQELGAGL